MSRSPTSCMSPFSSATLITPGRSLPRRARPGGTVEPVLADRSGNTNGLVRRYLPHCTDLYRVTQEDLDAISTELNDRPRKCLDFLTPAEVLYGHPVALRS
jgi:hypothetical protein